MATGSSNLDPRFDPAFQRGYSESGERMPSDAVRAARTVDAFRDESAAGARNHARDFAPRTLESAGTSTALGSTPPQAPIQSSTQAPIQSSNPTPTSVRRLDAPRDLSPQAHYVDDAGTLVEINSAGRGKSLARNPWIYVLWAVGGILTVGGVLAQTWVNSQLYSQSGPNFVDYGLITTVQSLGPTVATAGSLCIVGALIVHALNWMRLNP